MQSPNIYNLVCIQFIKKLIQRKECLIYMQKNKMNNTHFTVIDFSFSFFSGNYLLKPSF